MIISFEIFFKNISFNIYSISILVPFLIPYISPIYPLQKTAGKIGEII